MRLVEHLFPTGLFLLFKHYYYTIIRATGAPTQPRCTKTICDMPFLVSALFSCVCHLLRDAVLIPAERLGGVVLGASLAPRESPMLLLMAHQQLSGCPALRQPL